MQALLHPLTQWHISLCLIPATSVCASAWPPQIHDNVSTFVTAAEYAVKDMAPDAAGVAAVTELSREGFVAGVLGTPPIRDVIKVNMLGPAPLESEDAESQVKAAWQRSSRAGAGQTLWQACFVYPDRGTAMTEVVGVVLGAALCGGYVAIAWMVCCPGVSIFAHA